MVGCQMMLSDVASAVGVTFDGSDFQINGVSTDTRAVKQGQLFVALKGPNYDAHDYIPEAIEKGASAVISERKLECNRPILVVKNSLEALGQLAAAWRKELGVPIIGITGSNGKTSVKEILATILKEKFIAVATRGNLNNDIGMPLTLLAVNKEAEIAIIEMGANHPKEIAYLTQIARPNVALITNAGAAHLEGFGSLQGVARAKGEIFGGLTDDGIAVVNADDEFVEVWRNLANDHKTISFGLDENADVSCSWQGDVKGSDMEVDTPNGKFKCFLKLAGKHNVMNALSATAAALSIGVEVEDIRIGLNAVNSVPGRLQFVPGINGSTIIDDTYNANPSSLNASLTVLSACDGEKYLALGDMGELGKVSESLHKEAGAQAKKFGINALYAVGDMSRHAIAPFGDNAQHFNLQTDLIDCLQDDLTEHVTLLVKGSRAMRMEKVVSALRDSANQVGST
jgi:UDP-N-acetylmuramoyl-tripeptide--D-alanyl-D-alanine ligase